MWRIIFNWHKLCILPIETGSNQVEEIERVWSVLWCIDRDAEENNFFSTIDSCLLEILLTLQFHRGHP